MKLYEGGWINLMIEDCCEDRLSVFVGIIPRADQHQPLMRCCQVHIIYFSSR